MDTFKFSLMFSLKLDIDPILQSTYSINYDDDNKATIDFSKSKMDISLEEKFTSDEKKVFNEYLDYLMGCDLALEKFHSVHIIQSDCDDDIKHYVQLRNINFVNENIGRKHSVFVNCGPKIYNCPRGLSYKNYPQGVQGPQGIPGEPDLIISRSWMSSIFNLMTIGCLVYLSYRCYKI